MHLRQFKVSLVASVALILSSVMGVQAQDERISKVPNFGVGQTLNECGSSVLNLAGNFDGFEVDGDTYTFPTEAASWAGTANLNTDLYPLSFPSGGELRFKAEIPEGGADTSVNFKFERLPYPDTEPSFSTANTVISGAETDYVVLIPAQDASRSFSSLLMFIVERDQPVVVRDVQVITAGDGDGDGVPDASDAFSADPAASIDSDGDGSPDAWNTCATAEDIAASTLTLDSDDDDDGTPDLQDSLPLNPYHSNPELAAFSAAFGGAVIDGVNYSVPTGAEVWAGFANENTALYPLSFATGGKITFTGSVADGGSADVRFRLEYKPHPDVDPAYDTAAVTVSGGTPAEYTIDIPSQGSNTYESLLLYVDTPDVSVTLTDISLEAVTAIADGDGDGIADADDAFPSDPAASVDTDGDGSPDDWNDGATAAQIDASTLTVDEDDDDDLVPDTSDVRPLDPNYADPTFGIFTGSFGGSVIDGVNFSVPTGAEVWAGFANENLDLYPFSFPDGGQITFTGSVASGGSADVRFRFEFKPHPEVDPAYDTAAVTVAGSTPTEYVIDIPSQGANTFESFLMYVDTSDVSVTVTSVVVTALDAVTDADGDGVDDADDAFPTDPAASVDTDGDGMPDDWNEGATAEQIAASALTVDEDDDNDGVVDGSDSRPLDDNFSDASAAEFSEAFGGAYYSDGLYVNPEGAESWAGFANMNTALYPISFPNGGQMTFTASVPLGGTADVYFRFEKNPHPDVDPSYDTAPVTISGSESATYTVDVPAQGENTFASFLMYVQTQDVAVAVSDVQLSFADGPPADPTLADFSEAFGGTTIGEGGIY
ncbi:MAG: hypothetical protein L7S45_06100, partial [Luminiphilus sp.]|nr:hypothetical protein [Luminiphilus sp.]